MGDVDRATAVQQGVQRRLDDPFRLGVDAGDGPGRAAGGLPHRSGRLGRLRQCGAQHGQTASQPLQGALAEFIDAGHYGAHVRRMRNLYAQRQALLFALARKHLAGMIELAPSDSGMQVAGWLADGVDDCAVAAAGHRAGLALRPVSPYWVGPGARPGLHLGYAALSESAMEPPVRQLARIIERGSRPSAAGGR